jgi:hypothetical protein
MNPLNYATFEASKRLVDAGIVLETEAVWMSEELPPFDGSTKTIILWKLYNKKEVIRYNFGKVPTGMLPAPSMAEVWRELPDHLDSPLADLVVTKDSLGVTTCFYKVGHEFESINPADALIDLLIFTRRKP